MLKWHSSRNWGLFASANFFNVAIQPTPFKITNIKACYPQVFRSAGALISIAACFMRASNVHYLDTHTAFQSIPVFIYFTCPNHLRKNRFFVEEETFIRQCCYSGDRLISSSTFCLLARAISFRRFESFHNLTPSADFPSR
jgi:hypothetical protein